MNPTTQKYLKQNEQSPKQLKIPVNYQTVTDLTTADSISLGKNNKGTYLNFPLFISYILLIIDNKQ